MTASIELLEMETMRPTETGLMRLKVKETVFTAHKAEDIENAIKRHYLTTQYPVGVTPGPESAGKHSFWCWGYFRKSQQHDTYKKAVSDRMGAKIFMSEKYERLGTSIYFEGALVDARTTFEILHNNYDVKLFVKFTDVEMSPM